MQRKRLALMLAAVLLLSGCGTQAPNGGEQMPATLTLTSPDVTADGTVPTWAVGAFGGYCDGENRSIALAWSGVPAGTASFVVSMIDGTYVHWVVTGLPASATGLAGAPAGAVNEGVVGRSIAGAGGYVGPCAAGHEYVYTVYALDTQLDADENTGWTEVLTMMDGHILGQASLATKRP